MRLTMSEGGSSAVSTTSLSQGCSLKLITVRLFYPSTLISPRNLIQPNESFVSDYGLALMFDPFRA